jgi:hypothetical protein
MWNATMNARALLLATVLLAGASCTGQGGGSSSVAPSGGAAGRMGPSYCMTVPADPGDRWQWNDLCHGLR